MFPGKIQSQYEPRQVSLLVVCDTLLSSPCFLRGLWDKECISCNESWKNIIHTSNYKSQTRQNELSEGRKALIQMHLIIYTQHWSEQIIIIYFYTKITHKFLDLNIQFIHNPTHSVKINTNPYKSQNPATDILKLPCNLHSSLMLQKITERNTSDTVFT